MRLAIQRLLPKYFHEEATLQSEVWGKDIAIEPGELVKVVAPSGSGKSSLVSFLYGTRSDFSGTIAYGETDLRKLSLEELASLRRDRVSIVFQDMKLFADQTVAHNLEIKRQLNPYHPASKIDQMAERLGISSKLSLHCGTCSYGEQQRVAIIRSLLQPFDILLLDEPFSHLDNNNSQKAMDLILEESRARNATVIFADLERSELFPFNRLYHL